MPVISSIERFHEIKLSPCTTEVEKIFTVDLEKLAEQQLRRHTQFRSGRGYATPVFIGGDERIWGMTAILTHLFLGVLFPKDLYNRKIPFVRPYRISQWRPFDQNVSLIFQVGKLCIFVYLYPRQNVTVYSYFMKLIKKIKITSCLRIRTIRIFTERRNTEIVCVSITQNFFYLLQENFWQITSSFWFL